MAPVGSVLAALPCVVVATWAGGVARDVVEGIAPEGGTAGGVRDARGGGGGAEVVSPALAMPPWPRQAPRPPFEVEPSLQVTVVAAPSASGALSAVPALAMPPCPRQAPRPPFEVEPSLQVTVLADPSDSRPVVGALVAEPPLARFPTPPAPRRAPRPPAALVPSLQVTVAPVAARAKPPENIVATNSAEVTRSIRIYSS